MRDFLLKTCKNYKKFIKMKTAQNLLKLLGVKNYTQRHIQLINDFLKSGEEDVKKLLDQLGSWDSNDLKQAEDWINIKPLEFNKQ